jgi:dTDP-4-amino-4,6-dideoxygalactose transaminase
MSVDMEPIVFNRVHVTGAEFGYMHEAIGNAHLASSGPFSRRCAEWLVERTGSQLALLTHSCTAALEMAFTLAEIGPGDEVIMPSFTFVTTANSVVGRGGVPVFVDVREDTLCLDERLLEAAITPRTKAVVPVHYAGVGCEMGAIAEIAERHGLLVVEDAAQGIGATASGLPLGGIGHLGALSFHETKNVSCGEGGALLAKEERFVQRAEIIHEKGTDRQRFFRGEVDKYSWVDVGSSYLLSDLAAAYLWAQLEEVESITASRVRIWNRYHDAFSELEERGDLRRPVVPAGSTHNGHLYYVLVDDLSVRGELIADLAGREINAVFHYVPLHTSAAGRRYGRAAEDLRVTESISDRLVRLPVWAGMSDADVERVIEGVRRFFAGRQRDRPRSNGVRAGLSE